MTTQSASSSSSTESNTVVTSTEHSTTTIQHAVDVTDEQESGDSKIVSDGSLEVRDDDCICDYDQPVEMR